MECEPTDMNVARIDLNGSKIENTFLDFFYFYLHLIGVRIIYTVEEFI